MTCPDVARIEKASAMKTAVLGTAAALLLSACGVGGMTRAMQPVVEGFEEGERISREIRKDHDNDSD
jgi:hypothetical protein